LWFPAATALAWCVGWLIRYVLTISKTLSTIPLAAVYTKTVFVILWLALCYVLVIAFMLWKNRKPYLLICSTLISLAAALLLSWVIPMTAKSQVTVLDVGQGQSIILQTKGKTFLVDCGGDHASSAADLAAETLLSMGVYRLDGVILTHYDGDHADGLPYLLTRIPADNIFLPERAEQEASKQAILDAAGTAAIMVHHDIHLSWENTTLSIFAPVLQSDDNESGLCVLFRGENCDILITGDLGITGENRLLLDKNIPNLTALIAGHHGSPYSTGEGILLMTKPEYVFISVSADNPYGHPNQAVLDRLEQYHCTVYRTDLDGTIVFRR
jgi:competence protein ComEC